MKEGFAPIYFEAPVGEKNLLEEYCKIHHLQKTDVLRSFIRGLKVNSTPNGSIDAVGYDSSGNVVATFTVPPKLAQELSGMATKITDVSVGYQVEINDKSPFLSWNTVKSELLDSPEYLEAQQELADAESLRSMAQQLLSIAERLES